MDSARTICGTCVLNVNKRLKIAGLIIILLATISGLWMVYVDPDHRMTAHTYMSKLSQTAHSVFSKLPGSTAMMSVQITESASNRSLVMLQRRDVLRSRCHQLHGKDHDFLANTNFNLRHFIYDDKYKVVYCFVPKVACTNLKRTFLILTGKIKQTDPLEIPHHQAHGPMQFKYLTFLRNLKNQTEVMYRFKNYKKAIFVREPFERILSAWRNKFGPGGESYFKMDYGRHIVKQFRKNANKESLAKGNDVSFQEFIQYLIELDALNKTFDMHWRRYTDLCYPCDVDYDFIGRYDTLDEDIDLLLSELGVSSFLRFPKRNETYKKAKTVDILTDYYKDIPKDHLKGIKHIFANDSFLFNFSIPLVVQNLIDADSTVGL